MDIQGPRIDGLSLVDRNAAAIAADPNCPP